MFPQELIWHLNSARLMKKSLKDWMLLCWLCAKEQAARFGLELQTEFFEKHVPNLMSEEIQKAFADSCDDLGLTHTSLASGAIHDGQSFDGICPDWHDLCSFGGWSQPRAARIHQMGRLCERRKCFIANGVEVGGVVTLQRG